MAYRTTCGKKVTLLGRFLFVLGTESYTRPPNLQMGIDTEAGMVLYCGAKCRDNDLRVCNWCKKYFSLKKTGAVEDDPALLICPSCLRKVEEVEQAHQKLVATMRSDEELTLLSYAEQHPEDSSGYLQLKDASAALRASVKAIKRHLRSNPYDVEALRLLKSAYGTLGKINELYDVDVRLQKAETLKRTGEQRRAEAEQELCTDYKSGIPFEEKCLRLLQKMGFIASRTTSTNDGGIDIIAVHSQPIFAGKYIIQCKD
jgi:hypothetical protein